MFSFVRHEKLCRARKLRPGNLCSRVFHITDSGWEVWLARGLADWRWSGLLVLCQNWGVLAVCSPQAGWVSVSSVRILSGRASVCYFPFSIHLVNYFEHVVFNDVPCVLKEVLAYLVFARDFVRIPLFTACKSSSIVIGASKALFASCDSTMFTWPTGCLKLLSSTLSESYFPRMYSVRVRSIVVGFVCSMPLISTIFCYHSCNQPFPCF